MRLPKATQLSVQARALSFCLDANLASRRTPAAVNAGTTTLRTGGTTDLQFTRNADGTARLKVLRKDGTLFITPAGPAANATGTPRPWFEELERAALRRAPGALVRAARIAIGLE